VSLKVYPCCIHYVNTLYSSKLKLLISYIYLVCDLICQKSITVYLGSASTSRASATFGFTAVVFAVTALQVTRFAGVSSGSTRAACVSTLRVTRFAGVSSGSTRAACVSTSSTRAACIYMIARATCFCWTCATCTYCTSR